MDFASNKKQKKLKPACHILTITQIRKMGKLLKLTTLTSAMESFMEPANLFLYSKPQLTIIHQYLLDNKLTQVKQPLSRTKQQEHARLLIDLIYPGYPMGIAREQAWRQDRESRPVVSKKGAVYFAYDLLPSKVSFERYEELLRLETPPLLSESISNSPSTPPSSPSASSTHRYTINMRKLKLNPAGSKNRNIRHHMYIWMSPRYPLLPHFTSLMFNGVESWCEQDKQTVDNRFKYIDITEKLKLDLDKSQDEQIIEMQFTLDESLMSANVKYVTICSVLEKSSVDLVCQLYTKCASNCISSAMATNKDINQTQRDAVHLLDQCQPKDRLCLDKTETLFLDCGRAFYQKQVFENEDDDNTDDELTMGNEYISLMDPILLTKINHPTRGIFCRHATCFDAKCFFQCFIPQQLWTCPICHIQIRGIQELYLDYDLKVAITTYPELSRFIRLQDGTYQSESQYQQPTDQPPLPSNRPLSPLILKQQPSLSPTPPSPLLLSENKHDDVDLLGDLDIFDCESMIEPPGKRIRIDLLDCEPVIRLD